MAINRHDDLIEQLEEYLFINEEDIEREYKERVSRIAWKRYSEKFPEDAERLRKLFSHIYTHANTLYNVLNYKYVDEINETDKKLDEIYFSEFKEDDFSFLNIILDTSGMDILED